MERPDREERLLKFAEAIADGRAVDWDLAAEADPESSESFDCLRMLESVVAAHAPVPDHPEGVVGETWGSLQIQAKIGEGSFGEVYRAFDPSLQREVALKLLYPDRARDERSSKRFLDEARNLARVRHDNVLVVHGADVHDGLVGMWTDLVRGKTLEQWLQESGPMSAREATLIGIDLCQALAAVHAVGQAHRDVKTQNVMRREGGRILLMDFGSAGVFSGVEPKAGEPLYGTALTVAPEVLRLEPIDRTSDLYSLGVLLYRLVTGRYPVEARTLPELIEKHERREWVALRDARPDLPADFVGVVERALEPHPAQRFASAGEMERALSTCLGMAPVAVPTPAPGPDPPFGKPRSHILRQAVRLAGGLAGVALLGLVISRLLPPSPSPKPVPQGVSLLTANAALYKEGHGAAEPLVSGGRIAPGDAINLELWGNEAMNVYVLNEDDQGRVYVLFPLPGLDLNNPLPPGVRHRLPGTRHGVPENWEVTSAGGNEDLVVIASRKPLTEVERQFSNIPKAEPGTPVQYRELDERALRTLRGIGGTVPAPPTARSERLSEILSDLAKRPGRERDLWIWQARLSNPPAAP